MRSTSNSSRRGDAFARGRDRDALRTLRPVRDALPDAASVRELMGLAHYRLGNFAAAATELDAFVELSNSVEQHPVLMDCYRARRRSRTRRVVGGAGGGVAVRPSS